MGSGPSKHNCDFSRLQVSRTVIEIRMGTKTVFGTSAVPMILGTGNSREMQGERRVGQPVVQGPPPQPVGLG